MIFRSPYDKEFEREQEIEHEAYQRGASNILNKIRAEIDEIPLSKPMVSMDGLYCYGGSKSITMEHFREKVFEVIDKYRNEVSE